MNVVEKNILNYKRCRDVNGRNGNRFGEAYFQAQIVRQIEQQPFSLHKKRDLRQHRHILFKILEEILGFDDEKYCMGIYYEIILASQGKYLTGDERECYICKQYFDISSRDGYTEEACNLHMRCIFDMAKSNIEESERYTANLLRLWERRYGIKNMYYIKMKCMTTWQKAKRKREQNQSNEAVKLLEEIIEQYLNPKNEDMNLLYGYIYLESAVNYWKIGDADHMYKMAQDGIKLCERFEGAYSELYYNLYNYIGIKMILDNNLKEAWVLYSKCIKDIETKFGTENENYYKYMNNLHCIAMKEGRSIEFYTKAMSIRRISNERLKKQCIELLCNELYLAWSRGAAADEIQFRYEECLKHLDSEAYGNEREKIDTVYLASRINEHIYDDEAYSIMRRLQQVYIDNFNDEYSIIYWNSIAAYEWEVGREERAFEIYERIMKGIKKEKDSSYIVIVINYTQLLIQHKQYGKAKGLILAMLSLLEEKVLAIGVGNISLFLHLYRILISMYIHMLNIPENNFLFNKKEETELLLEKIIYCKTIEREIKSLLRKYKKETVKEELHLYCQANKKLVELELSMLIRGENGEDYENKKREVILEIEEQRAKLNQKIPFSNLIKPIMFNDMKIPENAVCAEYFAYFCFRTERPMTSASLNEDVYNYVAFVLGKNNVGIEILDMEVISIDESVEHTMDCLLQASIESPEYRKEEVQGGIRYLHSLFAMPVLKYAKKREIIYLGVDFLMQMLPMDLVFHDNKNEPMNLIMADSVRYIREDAYVDFGKADALVIGNPIYSISEPREQKISELPQSEKECREIARMLKMEAYIGRGAKKKLLWEKAQSRIIHISTHGVIHGYEVEIFSDLLLEPYLVMAGYEDWKAEKEVEDYGNGIVTGSDILLTDFSGTDLLVLSACVSSLGIAKDLEILHGLRWAAGVAGVSNSITALWEVNDSASAILMILFYRNLMKMPIGKALYEAKQSLRRITVDDLKKDAVFCNIVEGAQEFIADKDSQPFAHWKYWAGFVCYQ